MDTQAARQNASKLTDAQLRAIHVQRRQLGLDEDTYRQALAQYPCATVPRRGVPDWPQVGQPCTSSKHLSRAQARELITRMAIAGAPIGRPYTGKRPQEPGKMLATPAQRALISRLIPEVTWRSDDGYRRWLASRTSPTRGRPVRTYAEAEAVIEALKHMRGPKNGG